MQKLLVVILAVFLFSCSSGGGGVNDNMALYKNNLHEKARYSFQNGDYQSSVQAYKKLVEQSPENTEYLFLYAESLRLTNQTRFARDYYDVVLGIDPDALYALEGRGLSYIQDGEFEKSAVDLNKVIEQDASRWRTINAAGVIYALTGHVDEALEYYQMALDISGNKASILNNIGLSMALSGDSEGGIEILQKSLYAADMSDAKRNKIENNLALAYGVSGKMDEALRILRKNMSDAAAYNNLGYYASLASDKDLARTYLSKSLSLSPVHYDKAWQNLQNL